MPGKKSKKLIQELKRRNTSQKSKKQSNTNRNISNKSRKNVEFLKILEIFPIEIKLLME